MGLLYGQNFGYQYLSGVKYVYEMFDISVTGVIYVHTDKFIY